LLRGITGLLSCKNPTSYLDKNPTHFKKNFRYFSVLYKSAYYHAVGQIVVSRRSFGMVEPWVERNSLEELNLKEFNRPALAVEILRWREDSEEVEVAAAEAPRRRQQPS
jgi:hypothetical protein